MADSSLKNALIQRLTPGLLSGPTLSTWFKLLMENRFSIDPPYWPRALAVTLASLQTSLLRPLEQRRFGRRLDNCEVFPPVFILGFWRSGTTHLHNLLAVDERLAAPNLFQVMNPHTFLLTERLGCRIMDWLAPAIRPQDQVRIGAREAAEDEFACVSSCAKSHLLRWVFPRTGKKYDRFLLFRGVEANELAQWRSELRTFVCKLNWKYRRPIVLKSPSHTARIRLLLELFPTARFVHIHRHPFIVYQSFQHTMRTVLPYFALQRFDLREQMEDMITLYETMHDALLTDRALIPEGQFHQLAFETLESDPIGQLRQLYAALRLPEFSPVQKPVERYLGSLSGYRKNVFPELPDAERQMLQQRWARFLTAFGYNP